MMSQIRRDGADGGQTIFMEYGDSISQGWGSTDIWKMSFWSMLNEAYKKIDPSFQVIERGWGTRCARMGKCFLSCDYEFAKAHPGQIYDWRCVESLGMNVSAVFLMYGTNDAKVHPFEMEPFKVEWLNLCKRFMNMTSKPDIFVTIPPPLYMDGYVPGSRDIYNQRISLEIPKMAKECGVPDDQIIDLFNNMGGKDMTMPQLYCDKRWCDGFHPVDAGQDIMAREIMKVMMNFYMKTPKGRQGTK